MAAKREQQLRFEAEEANAVKDRFLAVYALILQVIQFHIQIF